MSFAVDHLEIWWWTFFASLVLTVGFSGFFWTEKRLSILQIIGLAGSMSHLVIAAPLALATVELAKERDVVLVLACGAIVAIGAVFALHNLVRFLYLGLFEVKELLEARF